MPATYSAEFFTARERNLYVEFDVTTTDSTVADLGQAFGSTDNLISLSQYGGLQRFYAALVKTVGTGNTDEFSIIAATDAAGTGSPTVVVQTATATASMRGGRWGCEQDADKESMDRCRPVRGRLRRDEGLR